MRETGILCGILLGIEGCAPQKENCFGAGHTAAAVSQDQSAFGKKKWKFYAECGQEVPAAVGGIHVAVDAELFEDVKKVVGCVNLSKPSDKYVSSQKLSAERALFQGLLQSCDAEIETVL